MTKIAAEHLARSAIVYIRQSTSYQVAKNLESQRRQYALVERGRLLGRNDVQVIDDDLGRSIEAIKQKAQRGELFRIVAIGYVKTDDGRIEKDPDRRVQDAIDLVFHKFVELQSIRQVLAWMRREQILLPAAVHSLGRQSIEWKAPVYRALHHILTNPVYAGAYAFGRRTGHVKIENGRKRIIRRERRNWKDWDVLIKGHHEGYISWDEFERNQRLIADNANRRSNMGRGSLRGGEALLPGLLRCARCGRKLKVAYSGPTQRY